MEATLQEKYDRLKNIIAGYGSIAVAFSGGVDSTLLLWAAHEALGDKAIAITASSESFPERERNEAKEFCKKNGIEHYTVVSEELDIEGFANNPTNRCYLCKSELFTKLKELANEKGIAHVAEGSNMDDEGDYRPGLQAIKELNVKSPLREAGLTKQEIRGISKSLELPTWDKQSFACLASRFVYGELITKSKLGMVDKAEQLFYDKGFKQFRVRIHGEDLARIEVMPEEFDKLLEIKSEISDKLKGLGFKYITMDLMGYRTGSMNEAIKS